MRAVALASLLFAALAAAPAADAAGTSLYVHVLDALQDMPVSVQAPPAAVQVDAAPGLGTTSASCLPNPGPVGAPFQDYHTFYGYAMPLPLAYDTELGSSLPQPRVEPMRGLAGDVSLAGAAPILHWYWSAAASGGPAAAPVALPNVVVHATLRAGDAISIDNAAYNSGPVLAEGTSPPALLAGEATSGATHSVVGGRDVYEFTVPLQAKAETIPAATGYNLRVDTYVVRDGCPADGYLMPNVLALHSSDGHRPRLELANVQRLDVETVHPAVNGTAWTFDVRTTSPWGAVDVANFTAEVVGPDGATHQAAVADPYQMATHCHCDEFGAYASHSHDTRVTWNATGAAPGAYKLRLRLTNLQGTAEAGADVPFTVAGARDAPSVGPALVVAALAALGLALRRRS